MQTQLYCNIFFIYTNVLLNKLYSYIARVAVLDKDFIVGFWI